MKVRLLAPLVALLGMFLSFSAHAILPAEATAAFTEISTAVTDVLAAVWPIVAAVLAGFITIKLVKKGANRGT